MKNLNKKERLFFDLLYGNFRIGKKTLVIESNKKNKKNKTKKLSVK